MTALDLAACAGLTVVFLVTLNLFIGTLIAFRFSPWRYWPHRRFDLFWLHRRTGYLVLTVSILHPIISLFSQTGHFRVRDILISGSFAESAARENDRRHRALPHCFRFDHVTFPLAARTPCLEVVPLLQLCPRDRPLLAQPVYGPQLEKFTSRPFRRRKIVRRDLRPPHCRVQFPPLVLRSSQSSGSLICLRGGRLRLGKPTGTVSSLRFYYCRS